MGENNSDAPTFRLPSFVGGHADGEQIVQALIHSVERLLSGELNMGPAPYRGELSDWITELLDHPAAPVALCSEDRAQSLKDQLLLVSDAAIGEASEAERRIVHKVLDQVPQSELKKLIDAVARGDLSNAERVQAKILREVELKLGRPTEDELRAMMSHLTRLRAFRATCLCMIFNRALPLPIIAKAKAGDRRAVLDLIKLDKLFAVDNCTREVLRSAALQADKGFINQVARALQRPPKVGPQKACRLYLYTLWALNVEVPRTAKLQLLIDPQGKRFATFEAFEKFVERCKADFRKIVATLPPSSDGTKQTASAPASGRL